MRTRRFCRSKLHEGPRWVSHTDFHVKVWGDAEKTWPAQLQSVCKACQRMHQREKIGIKRRGKAFEARKPRMTPEQVRARKRELYQEEKKDKARMEARRARAREVATFKRRERGVAARRFRNQQHTGEAIYVDAVPFLEWFTEWCVVTGQYDRVIQLVIDSWSKMLGREIDRDFVVKRLGDLRRGARADLAVLDLFANAMDMPDQLNVLYPLGDDTLAEVA